MKKIIPIIILTILWSCKPDPSSLFVERDLMAEGVPIVIKAPAEAEVKMEDYGFVKDITVKSGDSYFVQIIESQVINYDIKSLKEELLTDVKSKPFFSQVILEEENGFLFEKKLDEETLNYDFRYIKIQGDNQYTFQRGLMGLFSREQVEAMYNSVK